MRKVHLPKAGGTPRGMSLAAEIGCKLQGLGRNLVIAAAMGFLPCREEQVVELVEMVEL